MGGAARLLCLHTLDLLSQKQLPLSVPNLGCLTASTPRRYAKTKDRNPPSTLIQAARSATLESTQAAADGWLLGTRAAPDSPAARSMAGVGAGTDGGLRTASLEAQLFEARAALSAMEEDVVALQLAASAPREVAEVPVSFRSPNLQVGPS